jgi:3-hydroxyisobutyrate dehydrogenase-like beta-hydroxyacid dehydrogenase
MGSALARALLGAGHSVTVWNRTASRMGPLVALGANDATSVADAAQASSMVLVCVDNYSVTRSLLDIGDVTPHLSGRTLIQLSTGTPHEARESEGWASKHGAGYLDGAILGLPGKIGSKELVILVSGKEIAFAASRPTLQCLAGDLRYVGEPVGAAAALDLAYLSQRFGLFMGLAHGVRICESEKVSADHYAALFPKGDRAREFTSVVHEAAYGSTGATLAVYYAALQRVQSQARDAKINCEVPNFAAELFDRAIAAGHGLEDVAALVKVLRDKS